MIRQSRFELTAEDFEISATPTLGDAPGVLPWFVNAQNMGRRDDTGEYMTLIYGGKACSYLDLCGKKAKGSDENAFLSHGELPVKSGSNP